MRYNLYKLEKENIYKYDSFFVADGEVKNVTELFVNYENTDIIEISEDNYAFPILGEDGLREMTREEKIILLGDTILLKDGEYLEDCNIVQVPDPSTQYLKYKWDKKTFQWELTTTKEELQQEKTGLILEHNKKRKEIASLNEESEYFDVSKNVSKANSELAEIRAKINEIDKLIEEMD